MTEAQSSITNSAERIADQTSREAAEFRRRVSGDCLLGEGGGIGDDTESSVSVTPRSGYDSDNEVIRKGTVMNENKPFSCCVEQGASRDRSRGGQRSAILRASQGEKE